MSKTYSPTVMDRRDRKPRPEPTHVVLAPCRKAYKDYLERFPEARASTFYGYDDSSLLGRRLKGCIRLPRWRDNPAYTRRFEEMLAVRIET